MGKIIGIDLGTTNSCVAVVEGRSASGVPEVTVLPNPEGARTTPSVVGFAASGERLVGQVAKRQAVTNARNTVYAFKRLMGRKFDAPEVARHARSVTYSVVAHDNGDAWIGLDATRLSPPEVSSMVLAAIKDAAEQYLGEPVSEAIITVPAYFDDAQRQATKDAGRIAGLNVQRILNEPTAAALAYGLTAEENQRIAVYDLGGGTFDISVLELASGVFTVKATGGDTHLGGEDFDVRLCDTLAEEFLGAHGVDLRQDGMSLQRLREAVEKAKHELSSSLETQVNVPFIAMAGGLPLHLERTIKRSELEILTADLIERTIQSCRDVLRDAGSGIDSIAQVVLVGGMTRMPAVRRAVTGFFGRAPHQGVNPDEVVATGAAVQAALLSGDASEVLLLDVTPLSIGVETGGGVCTVLIPRNTTIPAEKSEIFTTSVDNQSFVPVHALQGERPMAQDNRSLAKFELTGIPPAPRGVPKIQVTFRVDANGILSVEARDLGTGATQAVSASPTSGLSEREINDLVEGAARFKQTDEERRKLAELRNQAEALLYTSEQALTGYAELIAAEVAERIQERVELLKAAVRGEDGSAIAEAYTRLESATFTLAEAMYGEGLEAREPGPRA